MNNYITTYSGKKINSFDLKLEDICLEDISNALSLKVRFGGQLHHTKFFSIAQHSVNVSKFCYNNSQKNIKKFTGLAGLFHDAPEALSILGDVCKPGKHLISIYAYDRMMNVNEYENKSAKIIFEALGIKNCLPFLFDENSIVHYADKVMCQSESFHLRNFKSMDNNYPIIKKETNFKDFDKDLSYNFTPQNPRKAYKEFMNQWEFLNG